jgi:HEAT repeats/Outer membrane lipoprotein
MVSLLLLRTVATLVQVPAIPPIPPVPQVPVQAAMELSRVGVQLAQLSELRGLASLSGLSEARNLAELAYEDGRIARHAHRGARLGSVPPESWSADDPADSLYRAARDLLNRGKYAEAATAFADLAKRYPRSTYTPDAYYWQAFSLYKTGETSKLKLARSALQYQQQHYPETQTRGDADALYAQIQGALARQGDADARAWVDAHARGVDSSRAAPVGGCSSGDDDDDPRIAALNALLQMDADRAVPVLKKVLERRDACSVSLRRKAVFIISQQHTPETEDILLSAARNDPDEDVREQAVFWLSQVGSAKAASALDSILLNSTNPDLQKKAVFALSQIDSPEAMRMLRDYAEKQGAPVEARADAIFWLSQQGHGENAGYLRTLYGQLTDEDLKDKTIFAISQIGGADNLNWLMDLAVNEQESVEIRKKALFWAGQSNDVSLERLTALYDRMKNRDMKEQMIFVYSQRREGQALDKLIDIARHDTDPELRKKAIFWIGQSHDPKAAQYLQEVINQ